MREAERCPYCFCPPRLNIRKRSPTFVLFTLALLLALGHAVLATFAMRAKSTTADEVGHLTGGYAFNTWNDHRFQPENGNLPQRWEALPATLAGVRFPAMDDKAWRKTDVWLTGSRFLHQSGNDPAWMLAGARAMNSLFGAATVLLVFFWSRRLWGAAGALASATFCALGPTMLAHSGLATSDMCMAFFLLLAVTVYWRHLNNGRVSLCLLSAGVFGLASVAKYTSLLLLPMVMAMIAVRLVRPEPLQCGRRTVATWPGKLGVIGLSLALHAIVVVAFIWAFFGFRYTAFNPSLPAGDFAFPWELMLSFGGLKARIIDFCRSWHLLPEGYLYGLAFVLKHSEARAAFLDGDYGIYGWVSFFPKAFLYKTPLSLLSGLIASTVFVGVRLRAAERARIVECLYRVTPLLALFVIYWIFSLTSHLNIGHRHILPTYPVLYIFCGALGWAAARAGELSRASGGAIGLVLAGLLGWHATVAARIYPHYLAYFSPVVGGPAEGYKHLVDSSLDWGQDLPGLKKWLVANRQPGEQVYLSYFGTGDPAYYGIDAVQMEMIPDFRTEVTKYRCEPGLYAIGATMLQHVYAEDRGPWTAENERQYQYLRSALRTVEPGVGGRVEPFQSSSRTNEQRKRFHQLRFARLCQYLRARPPDAMIGYSILIFRLTQSELDAALNGSPRELGEAILRTLGPRAQPPVNHQPGPS